MLAELTLGWIIAAHQRFIANPVQYRKCQFQAWFASSTQFGQVSGVHLPGGVGPIAGPALVATPAPLAPSSPTAEGKYCCRGCGGVDCTIELLLQLRLGPASSRAPLQFTIH